MKRFARFAFFTGFLLLVTFVLTACGGGGAQPTATASGNGQSQTAATNPGTGTTTSPTSALDTSALPTNAAGIPIVARVNDIDILKSDYDSALARSQQLSIAADPAALARTVLDTLIEQHVIEQAAASLNITVTDAEIDADINNMSNQAGSPEAWDQWKRDNLYTDEEYRAATRSQLITLKVRDTVLAQM
ncbi:MAG TPA: SurA N-terminal domain-containing protein, partial [Phototrophicaceae bacterium]|nr:SurA N-terminal domain-containing protein [Phototrophicaceae bacterium]